MKCRYCNGEVHYIQIEKQLVRKSKTFLIDENGRPYCTVSTDTSKSEKEYEDYVMCEQCNHPYHLKKRNGKIVIDVIADRRLKNALYNLTEKLYDSWSEFNLVKILKKYDINVTEILDYIHNDTLISGKTMDKLIMLFEPPKEIEKSWIARYTQQRKE